MIAAPSDWKEVQSVRIPKGTVSLYKTITDNGKTHYTLNLSGYGIPVSENNARKYLSGVIDLEVVKWYNKTTNKYKYTTRQYKPSEANIDLEQYFKNQQESKLIFKQP